MKIRGPILATIITTLSAFVAGCAITTTYGNKPTPVTSTKDTFTFPIYYNTFSTDTDIEKAAMVEIEKIKASNGYRECEFERLGEKSIFSAAKYDFKVTCAR